MIPPDQSMMIGGGYRSINGLEVGVGLVIIGFLCLLWWSVVVTTVIIFVIIFNSHVQYS